MLFVLLVAAGGCDRVDLTVTSPAPAGNLSSAFATDPVTVRPEFLHSVSCVSRPAFSARFNLIIGGSEAIVLRSVRFAFTGASGGAFVPEVFLLSTGSGLFPQTTVGASSLVPFSGISSLPSASPISIPGLSPVHGVYIPRASSHVFPFYLRFGCGAFPEGVVVITTDAVDANGVAGGAQLRVRLVN